MNDARLKKISRTYDRHPLRAATILARLQRTARSGDITEVDLATDDVTFITDQNHTGGVQAVVELAEQIGLKQTDRVLDVGTGLGGTVRVLAERYGCHCHGIELTESRYRDAIQLTQLVGLQNRVTFSHGDFLSVPYASNSFQVIIGQDTFMHFDDLNECLRKCSTLLTADGWLVAEDGFVRQTPADENERHQLTEAWEHWNGHFSSLEEWQRALQDCGLRIVRFEDLTARALADYAAKLQRCASDKQSLGQSEQRGWLVGQSLMQANVIGAMRLLCRRSSWRDTDCPTIDQLDQ